MRMDANIAKYSMSVRIIIIAKQRPPFSAEFFRAADSRQYSREAAGLLIRGS
jgi:hypothetical protein